MTGGIDARGGSQSQYEERQRYDGAERVPLLPWARLVALAPAAQAEDPVAVWIEWIVGLAEHPLPGSALWRAVLTSYLERERSSADATMIAIRRAVEVDLRRFSSLDRWLDWRDRERRPPERPDDKRSGSSRLTAQSWWPW